MKNKKTVISQRKSSRPFTLFVFAIGLFLFSYYLYSITPKEPYVQLMDFLIPSIGFLIGTAFLLHLYFMEEFHIHDGVIEIKSIFGKIRKKINIRDIIKWKEVKKRSQQNFWKVLIIYTENTKHSFSSYTYHNYEQLRSAMTAGKPRIENLSKHPKDIYNLQVFFLCLIGALILFYSSYNLSLNKDIEINQSQLHRLKDSVTNKIEVSKGRKNRHSISLKLKSESYFTFIISNEAYKSTMVSDFISNVRAGDSIVIDISKEEYMMKISKEKELDFWTKRVNYPFISIYNLNAKGKNYLHISDYNAKFKAHRIFTIYVCFFTALLLIAIAIYHYFKYKLSILKKN